VPSDFDADKLKIANMDDSCVLSTRINIVRNLESYPYLLGIDKEKRLELMNEVVDACETLKDELSGKFVPFKGMGRTE
jgi:protein-arginine kinase